MHKFSGIFLFIVSLWLGVACSQKVHQSELASKSDKKESRMVMFEQLYTEGMKQYILDNHGHALANFEKAYEVNQDNAAVNYMLAKIYHLRGENNKAIVHVSKAVKLDDKNKYYFELQAMIYEKLYNYDEAIRVIKKMLAEIPHTEEHYFDLAAYYAYKKNYDEAIKAYAKLEEVYGMSSELTRMKQQAYIRKNDVNAAIAEGEALIKAFPDQSEYKIMQAEFLMTNNRQDEAMKILETVLKDEPDNAYAHLILSDIYRMKGKNKEALKELEFVFKNPDMDFNTKAKILEEYAIGPKTDELRKDLETLAEILVKAHPTLAGAYIAYGDILLSYNNREGAWEKYLQAKRFDQSNYNLWLKLITIDSELNKLDSMVRHADEALELFPNQAIIWYYKGTALSQQKKYTEAVEALEEGKKLSANNVELKTYINIHLGDTYYSLKDYKRSDASFEEVLSYDSNNDHVLNNYSYYLSLRRDKLDKAKEMSSKLIKKNPSNPVYLDTYAWVLYMLKEYEEAKKYLEIAVSQSGDGTIIEHYGDVLFQLGQKESAIEQWRKAKKAGEASEYLDKKIADGKLYE